MSGSSKNTSETEQVPTLIKGDCFVDDRGELAFINGFSFEGVKRFYQVSNHDRNFVRAWHGHRIEGKYVYLASGSALVGTVNMDDTTIINRFVLSAKKPSILWIPPNNYNGFMNLEDDTRVIFFSTATIEETKNDDYREPFDKWNLWEIERR